MITLPTFGEWIENSLGEDKKITKKSDCFSNVAVCAILKFLLIEL